MLEFPGTGATVKGEKLSQQLFVEVWAVAIKWFLIEWDKFSVLIIMADFKHGLAGGIAGIAVDLVFYPLETIKTRIMGSSPGENFTSIARSRFKGFSCQMIVSFPYSFTFFYTYETIRWLLPNNPMKNVLASVCAEIIANLVRNPFEVVKQQLMVGRS